MVKKGFTLIEIMIVVGLLGVTLTLTTGILLSVVKTSRKQEIVRSIERDGDLILRQIEENVRKANSVRTDTGNLIVQIPQSDGTTLTRYIGQVEDTGNCTNNYIFIEDGGISEFYKAENRLTSSTINSIGVKDFTVNLYSDRRPAQVFVTLTLESCYDTSISKTFQTFVTARGTYY